jgi:hypothetical protein
MKRRNRQQATFRNMNQPEELVWNEITDSAKKRFGYDEFQKVFAAFDNDYISENVLCLTIAGHAEGDSAEDIAAGINRHLLPMGVSYPIDALLTFISDRRADLGAEIKAAETAIAFFRMGLEAPGILVQVRSMLSKS